MTAPYPTPNITGTVGLIEYANTVTQGWVTILFMIILSFAIFMLMKSKEYKTSDSFTLATFTATCLGALLWAAGLVAGSYIVLFLTLFMASLLYSLLDRN